MFVATQGQEVEEFQHNPGLYLEPIGSVRFYDSDWKIVPYIDYTVLDKNFFQLKNYFSNISKICKQVNVQELTQHCFKLLNIESEQIKDINKNREILKQFDITSKNRSKRSFWHIFGILDHEDAVYYNSQISSVLNNEQENNNIILNQTSIIQSLLNQINSTDIEIETHINYLQNGFISKLGEVENIQKKLEIITKSVNILSRASNCLLGKQKELFNIISFAEAGVIHPNLLTPTEFELELNKIHEIIIMYYNTTKL